MPDFVIGRKDTSPSLEATLKDGNGVVVNLTGATVRFYMSRPRDVAYKTNALATVVSPATDGKVKYAFTATDTDTEGTFQACFRVTFSGGAVETFPNSGSIGVKVSDDPLI